MQKKSNMFSTKYGLVEESIICITCVLFFLFQSMFYHVCLVDLRITIYLVNILDHLVEMLLQCALFS